MNLAVWRPLRGAFRLITVLLPAKPAEGVAADPKGRPGFTIPTPLHSAKAEQLIRNERRARKLLSFKLRGTVCAHRGRNEKAPAPPSGSRGRSLRALDGAPHVGAVIG